MIKSYASYFVSYLLGSLKDVGNVKNIILFGSVAKGNSNRDSDVDIFIEIKKNNLKFKSGVEKTLEEFYQSRDALIFKNKGIDNKINVIVGKLDDWSELRKSIEGTGILLYGSYVASGVKGKKYILISWDKIGKNRGAFLNKLYGFKVNGKRYKGLIDELQGRKIGKSSLMVPIEGHKDIMAVLKHYDVSASFIEVWNES
ncbi:MAG: nucleotidyltransferase domain-containing protein [Candidatus Pacearchaeota archaeon]|nr:nucleotidyltransferase domain-containing protein [Candidatus Pacearchaeota archaeon]